MYQERIKTCRKCKNKKVIVNVGIHCKLTNEFPTFNGTCPDFDPNYEAINSQHNNLLINKNALQLGKERLLKVLLLLFVISLITTAFSFSTFKNLNIIAAVTTGIRFAIELLLYFLIFNGKKWAKVILIILLSIGILISTLTTIALLQTTPQIAIVFLLIPVYGFVIYQLTQNTNIKNWIDHQEMQK